MGLGTADKKTFFEDPHYGEVALTILIPEALAIFLQSIQNPCGYIIDLIQKDWARKTFCKEAPASQEDEDARFREVFLRNLPAMQREIWEALGVQQFERLNPSEVIPLGDPLRADPNVDVAGLASQFDED